MLWFSPAAISLKLPSDILGQRGLLKLLGRVCEHARFADFAALAVASVAKARAEDVFLG